MVVYVYVCGVCMCECVYGGVCVCVWCVYVCGVYDDVFVCTVMNDKRVLYFFE